MIIYMYHSLTHETTSNSSFVVTKQKFEKQINYIKKRYKIVSIVDIEKYIHEKDVAILTFDDGYLDNYSIAYQYLKQFNIPFTIFLSTKFIENSMVLGCNELPFLSWDMIYEMHNSNLVYFASHTHSHLNCKEHSCKDIIEDIDKNIEQIESHLGYKPKYFCYPKGKVNNTIFQYLHKNFDFCFKGNGVVPKEFDKLKIPRIELHEKMPNFKLTVSYNRLKNRLFQ
ncbi:MAG: polysaccharide deacetylase family protein [Campylobacterales bacterium]|nr:polysaccharide deacetylase family protein [Campylobacterales bacterium]